MARIGRGQPAASVYYRRRTGLVAELVTAPGAGGVATVVLDGTPEGPGMLAVAIGMNNGPANGTWQSPMTSLYASNNGTLAVSIGWQVLVTGTETLTCNVTRARIRVPIYDKATRVVTFQVSYGTGTSATQSALDVTGAPGAQIYDLTFAPNPSITMGDPSNMANHSSNTSVFSWRSAVLPGGASVGAVSSFTPAAVSLSSSVDWSRATIAVE